MLPQLGVGGWMPKPRKLSPDSMRMAQATPIVALTMTGPAELGAIWWVTMRASDAPYERAAVTNSSSFNERNVARTSRATLIQDVAPITSAMLATPPLRSGS